MTNLFARRIGIAIENLARGHNHSGCAVTALQAVMLPESLLHRVEIAIGGHTFNCRDIGAIRLDRQHRAGLYRLSVQQNCARPTARSLTADVCTSQPENVAQVMNEQQPRLDLGRMIGAINVDTDSLFHSSYLASISEILRREL